MSKNVWPWLLVGGGAFAVYRFTRTQAPQVEADESKKIGKRDAEFDPREDVLTVAIPFDTARELDITRTKGGNPTIFEIEVYGPWSGIEEIGLSANPKLGGDKFVQSMKSKLKKANSSWLFEVTAETPRWDEERSALTFNAVIDIAEGWVITNGIRLDPSESESAGLGDKGAFILEYQED
tara:strand:+ start:345 stop:884 length:540 start_codon:yes stop_codon:yes gene_type:complete